MGLLSPHLGPFRFGLAAALKKSLSSRKETRFSFFNTTLDVLSSLLLSLPKFTRPGNEGRRLPAVLGLDFAQHQLPNPDELRYSPSWKMSFDVKLKGVFYARREALSYIL